MNFRTTYVLFGILAGLFLVLGLALWLAPVPSNTSNFLFPSLNAKGEGPDLSLWNGFDHVEIDKGTEKLEFVRDAKTQQWTVNGYPADTYKVDGLIHSICGAKKAVADRPQSLADWGLDNPNAVVTFKSGDGKREIKLTIGGSSAGDDRTAVTYVLSSEHGNEPLAVMKGAVAAALGSLASFRNRDLLASNSSMIDAIDLKAKDKEVALKKVEERWQFTTTFEGAARDEGPEAPPDKPIKTVNDLAAALADLKVEYKDEGDHGFVADNVTDWAKYFLDPAKFDVLRAKVTRVLTVPGEGDKTDKVEKTATLLVALKEKVGSKKDKYYARLADGTSVYLVSAKAIDRVHEVLNDPAALRDRHLVKLPNFAQPDVIEITRDGQSLDFRRAGDNKPWKLYRGETGVPIDQNVLQGLISLLTDEYPTMEFPPASDAAALGLKDAKDAAAVVSLWVKGIEPEPKDDKEKDKEKEKDKKDKEKDKKETKPEPKKEGKPRLKKDAAGKPTVTLTFGKTVTGKDDKKLVAVKRVSADEKNGTLVLVPLLVLDRVREGPLFYFDKKLPQYNPNLPGGVGVTRLRIERGEQTYEVARDKDDAPWKIVKPTGLAGRPADAEAIYGILDGLNQLRATQLVAERATAKELTDTYGFKPPDLVRVTVTRTHDGKAADFVYEFGRQLPTVQADHYARQVFPKGEGDREMIFAVHWEPLRVTLEKGLEDLTLFKFKPAEVRGLKLWGWRNVAGLVKLDLESGDGMMWKVKKASVAFPIDSAKVARLVDYLSKLKAEKVVARGAAAKPEYGLDPNGDEALNVEISVKDSKEPLKLTVGKAAGDTGFYARASTFGDNVLLIPKMYFDELKQKPTWLKP
jgi:hypothetical protein